MLNNIKLYNRITLQSLIVCVALSKLQYFETNQHFAITVTTRKIHGTIKMTESNKDGSYTAVLIGATGATGKYLFAELVKDKRFKTITSIGRRPASIPRDFEGASELNLQEEEQSGRVQQINDVDMNGEINKETVGKHFEGKDVFFSCFGTTRKQAGSADEFRRIDLGVNYNMAKVAKECNVPLYSLVSTQRAHSQSYFLYLQTKGELDDKTTELGFDKNSIWRPGPLNRGAEMRLREKLLGYLIYTVPVQTLARALRLDALNRLGEVHEKTKGQKIYDNTDINAICGLDSYGKPVEERS